MRVKCKFFLLLGLLFILNKNLIQAAQIDIYTLDEIANIRLIGKIEKGDAEKFKKLIEDLRHEKKIINMLMLASFGGDAIEAMRIGTIVRESFIPTHAPFSLYSGFSCNEYPLGLKDDDCNCASACFLIWVAGVYRMGNVLGVHRPRFLEEYLEGLSASEAKKEYVSMYESVKSYLKNMDVPEHIINKMFYTESEETTYLDLDTAESMKSTPLFDEWVGTNCLRLTPDEEMDYWKLLPKKWERKSTLTESEEFYFNYLEEKNESYNRCLKEKFKEVQLKEKTPS